MKLTKLLTLLGITAGCVSTNNLDTRGPPYKITNTIFDLPRGIVTEEELNAYIRTANGCRLNCWEIYEDKNGNGEIDEEDEKKGMFASGRTYGMHLTVYATNETFLDGKNYQKEPKVSKGDLLKKTNPAN